MFPAALALGWAGTVAATGVQKFPATGQTTSYRPGDDGDIEAGATLRYKDNRNGTITDRNTGFVWEKKSADGSIHDRDNLYTWDEAFSVHAATLNTISANDETVGCSANADCMAAGVGGKCGFARKRDWRVPNVKELQSIVNYEVFSPSVSPEFHNNTCVADATVLTGSCTVASFYWSSTTRRLDPTDAWSVDFGSGFVGAGGKGIFFLRVRAVRGGL